jgi:hypothetical protein
LLLSIDFRVAISSSFGDILPLLDIKKDLSSISLTPFLKWSSFNQYGLELISVPYREDIRVKIR